MLILAIALALAPAQEPTVTDLLHAYYDGVFQDLSLTEGKWVEVEQNGKAVRRWQPARFGVSRIRGTPVVGQHYLDWTALSRKAAEEAKANGVEYFATVYGNGGKPLSAETLAKRFGPEAVNSTSMNIKGINPDNHLKFAKLALEPIRKGSTLQRKVDTWMLEARGVFLSKPECLKCHAGMKVGDPVAVMVYGTRR
ncbi:MAG: hypothetical protein AMXMBFR81_13520 [Chthonomonas sp.]|nr:hypothetical protein [Fimbriimonadaceae bacterium]